MPERIQLQRRKGWRKPDGAVVVARPSRWGNPFRVLPAKDGGWMVRGNGRTDWSADDPWTRQEATAHAVERFTDMAEPAPGHYSTYSRDAEIQLGGHDLACWCPLGQPCHADVLLRIANPTLSPREAQTNE
jgi:hypothetical protein